MFTTILRRFSLPRDKSLRKRGSPLRLAFEPLEQRAMLSVAPSPLHNLAENTAGNGVPAVYANQQLTLASLPAAAQQAVASALGQQAKLTVSNGEVNDYFGNAVAIDGNTIVVGDSYAAVGGNRTTGQPWEGAAYVSPSPAAAGPI